MTEQSHANDLPGMPRAIAKLFPLVRTGVLIVSVAAAVPTATNLYHSWVHGIPFNQVSHRLAQYDLWMKNLDCKVDYRALLNADGSRVDAGACPKTGDVAIKVSSARGGQATYEWIPADRLHKTAAAAALFDWIIPTAHAADPPAATAVPVAGPLPASRPVQVAQAAQTGMEVMCQVRKADKIVRIVKEGGKCFRETFSPLKGQVEKREDVACTTTC